MTKSEPGSFTNLVSAPQTANLAPSAGTVCFCVIPFFVAFLSLCGWAFNLPILRNPFPQQPPVAPSTAICLLAICIATLTYRSQSLASRRAALAASVLAGGVSSLVGLHYITADIFDIEQAFFGNSLALASGFAPGRMAPNAAVLIFLSSLACLIASLRQLKWLPRRSSYVWHACVLFTLISAVSLIIGFMYKVSSIYGVGSLTPIALPTAVSLLCLSCAQLTSNHSSALMQLLRGSGEGSYSIRRLLPAAVGIPILLGYLRGVGESMHLFDAALGVTLLVILMIVSFGVLIIRNGLLLNALSDERNKSLETIKCLYGDLTEARDSALLAARVKSDFLANMSHEIRTPMNAVIGCADMLQRTNLSSDQTRFVDIIMSSGSALVDIINDILVLSKIEAGKLEMDETPTNVVNLLESCAELVAEKANSKKLSLTTFVSPELNRDVLCDPQRLRQILLNVLSNAIKFTDFGSVSMQAHADFSTNDGVFVNISVSDTGIGISEQHLHKLFQPFSQLDSSGTRRYSGTGLGLAICKRLTELMGGSISVKSTTGSGSTFTISVPLKYAEDSAYRTRRVDVAGVNLLVVGVPPSEYATIKSYCDAWDVQADYAPDAPAALFYADMAATNAKPYTIVVCEPLIGQGGVDAAGLRKLLSGNDIRPLRFVLLNPIDNIGGQDEFTAGGFDAMLNKPIRQSDLFDTIVSVSALDAPPQSPNRNHGAEPSSDDESAPHPGGGHHTAGGRHRRRVDSFSSELPPDACRRILLVEDNVVNQEVAALQLRELGFEPQIASSGRRALDYLQDYRVALILMDCQMPEMDGFETTAAIRASELDKGIRTPIIAMTANAMEGDRELCLQAGMDDYIGKPVTAEKLRTIIENWFLVALEGSTESVTAVVKNSAGAFNNSRAAISNLPPTASNKERSAANVIISIEELEVPMTQLAKLFGEPAAERFLSMFLSQTPPLIEKIQSALISNDCQTLQAVAHELKGSCFAVNCNRLAELTYQIERSAKEGDIGAAAIALSPLERAFCRSAKHMEAWIHSRGNQATNIFEKQDLIRVMLVEDNELTRMGIATILEKLDGLVVCGEADDGLSAVQSIATVRPDVAVIDIGLPGMNGIEVTRRVKAITPHTKVLILTSNDDEEDMFGAFAAGADGYITKHTFDRRRLELAIRTVHSGACWLDPSIAKRILQVASSTGRMQSAAYAAESTHREMRHAAPLSESEQTLLQSLAAESADSQNGVCQVEPAFLEALQRFAGTTVVAGVRKS